jgi:squalene-associated FAD-dependent desaturase
LADSGVAVELFESRRRLGGRASSFRDPLTGELVDHCQHVSMGCCTNLADFCRRTGIADYFRSDPVLHFIGPDGAQYDFQSCAWLPAPLHLAPAFWRLKYLSRAARRGVARGLWRLMRMSSADSAGVTIGAWLRREGQSAEAIEHFWGVVLVSALGESVERASLPAARKVFVDGFLVSRRAYPLQVPRVPLGEVYGQRLQDWLQARGVVLHLSTPVHRVLGSRDAVRGILPADGRRLDFDFVVAAVPWRPLGELFDAEMAPALPWLESMRTLASSPITGVHLWYDRPIMSLPHAVLVGRLGQWVFNRGSSVAGDPPRTRFYYQVVISASRNVAAGDRQEVIRRVTDELGAIWPEARRAELLHARLVTEPEAVFSPSPEFEPLRPAQQTPVRGLLVAGDWTATLWPATMEGAVRSGYLAAERIFEASGSPRPILVPDLHRGFLARLLVRNAA